MNVGDDRGSQDAVRDYVALDRALTRLESISPARSAQLRLRLTRARGEYLRGGERQRDAYRDALALLVTATAEALDEVQAASTADPHVGLAAPAR